jgi:hypothetical protein
VMKLGCWRGYTSGFLFALLMIGKILFAGEPNVAGLAENFSATSGGQAPAGLNADSSCRLDELLPRVTAHVKEFVENVNRFSATEALESEQFDRQGKLKVKAESKSNYVATVQEGRKGVYWVDEYRNETVGTSDIHWGVAATGAAPGLALIFHASHVGEFNMTCEGLAEWQGHAVWHVSFEQRRDRPATLCTLRVHGAYFDLQLKGFALIDADNYQIRHIETDLLQPITEVRLDVDHKSVDYTSVAFSDRDMSVWLPQVAEITVDFKGKRLVERHTYSNYTLFLVETGQKIAKPKDLPK